MRMPVMDGWAFTRAYRLTPPPHAPIVVLTAARDAAEYAGDVDADAFLAKPFNLRELLGLVDRLSADERSSSAGRLRILRGAWPLPTTRRAPPCKHP